MTTTGLKLAHTVETCSPTMEAMLEDARRLVPRLRERAWQTEQDRQISTEIMDICRASGFFRLLQPKRFNGLERTFSDFVTLNLELGRGCGSTAWGIAISILHNWLVGLYPLAAQEEVWSDPDALVTGSYAPTGTCEAVDGGYMVSGAWSFASNCDHSAWFVVSAFLPKAEAAGPPAPVWFLVPRTEARIDDTWFSMGMAGTGSKTVVVDSPVFVPAYRALSVATMNSGDAPGAAVNDNPLYRLTFSGTAPFTLCSVPVGIALGAVEEFTAMASAKMASQPGGPPVLMAKLPAVQLAIGEASAMMDAVTLLLQRDVAEIDALHARGAGLGIPERIRHRRDHGFAARECVRATTLLFEALGANGGALSNPIQRAWRDVSIVARHLSLTATGTSALYGQWATGLKPTGTY